MTIVELNFLYALKLLYKDAYYIRKVWRGGSAFLDITSSDNGELITSILLVDRSTFNSLQYCKYYTFEELGIKENN